MVGFEGDTDTQEEPIVSDYPATEPERDREAQAVEDDKATKSSFATHTATIIPTVTGSDDTEDREVTILNPVTREPEQVVIKDLEYVNAAAAPIPPSLAFIPQEDFGTRYRPTEENVTDHLGSTTEDEEVIPQHEADRQTAGSERP